VRKTRAGDVDCVVEKNVMMGILLARSSFLIMHATTDDIPDAVTDSVSEK